MYRNTDLEVGPSGNTILGLKVLPVRVETPGRSQQHALWIRSSPRAEVWIVGRV